MLQVYHSIGIIGTVTCRSSNGRLNLEVPAGWECNFRMLPTACNDLLHVFLKLCIRIGLLHVPTECPGPCDAPRNDHIVAYVSSASIVWQRDEAAARLYI